MFLPPRHSTVSQTKEVVMRSKKRIVLALTAVIFMFSLAGAAQASDPIELAFAIHTAPGGPDHAAVEVFKGLVALFSHSFLRFYP